MSRVYLIADTHFGHENALRFRPQFKTIQEHDETIIQNWNSVVRKNYTVFLLGDFSFRATQEYLNGVRRRLNGQIKFIQGNHDIVAPENVVMMPPLVSYKGHWLSHAPIHPLELRGKKNIHGHTHSFKIPDENYLGVSCEQINFTPVWFEELVMKESEAERGKNDSSNDR